MRWNDILAPEFGPLFHAKAVLFVNNNEAKVLELYLILDQGVGAN